MNINLNNRYDAKFEKQELNFKKRDDENKGTTTPLSLTKAGKKALVGASIILASLGAVSCNEQNQSVVVDMSALIALIEKLSDQLEDIYSLMQGQYKLMLQKLEDILKQQIKNQDDQNIFNANMMKFLETFAKDNKGFQNAILDIMNDQKLTSEQRYQAIMKAVTNIAKTLEHIDIIVEAGFADISAKIENLTNEYKKGNLTLIELVQKSIDIAIEGNKGNDETLKELQDLRKDVNNNAEESGNAMGRLEDILNGIKDNTDIIIGKLDKFIESLAPELIALNKEILAEIKSWKELYQQDKISDKAYQENVLKLLAQIETNSATANAQLEKIGSDLSAGLITISQALDKIKEVLDSIKEDTAELVKNFGVFMESFNKFAEKTDNQLNNVGDQLGNLNNGMGDLNGKIDVLNKGVSQLHEDSQNQITSINNVEKAIKELIAAQGDNLTLADLEGLIAKYGPEVLKAYQAMMDKLEQNNQHLETITQLLGALEDLKTGISSIDNKLTVLAGLIQNSSKEQLDALKEKLDAIKESIEKGDANISDKIDAAIKELQDIKGILQTICANIISANEKADEFRKTALNYFKQSMNALKHISTNMPDKAQMQLLIDNFNAFAQQSNEYNAKFEGYLKELLAKKGPLTKEEMKEAISESLKELNIPDYSEKLTEISEKLDKIFGSTGSDITIEKLEQLFKKYQSNVDLSLITEQLDILIGLVSQQKPGGGTGSSEDLKRVEALVAQVLDAIVNGNLESAQDIKDVLAQLKEINEALKKADSGDVAAVKSARAKIDVLTAQLEKVSKKGITEVKGINVKATLQQLKNMASINNLQKTYEHNKNAGLNPSTDADKNYQSYKKAQKANKGNDQIRTARLGEYKENTYYWG